MTIHKLEPDWYSSVSAPRDGKFFLAWNGKRMAVINWPPGCAPGVWEYDKKIKDWIGGATSGFSNYFETWMPLPKGDPVHAHRKS